MERCCSNAGEHSFMAIELDFEASSAVTIVFAPSVSSSALGGWSDSLPERRSVRVALVAARVSLVDVVVVSIFGSSGANPSQSSGTIGAPAPDGNGRADGTQLLLFSEVKTLPVMTCLGESIRSGDPTYIPVGPHS